MVLASGEGPIQILFFWPLLETQLMDSNSYSYRFCTVFVVVVVVVVWVHQSLLVGRCCCLLRGVVVMVLILQNATP